jgi:hypothetical protein
MNRKSMS